MPTGEKESHESYGMLQISRTNSSHSQNLFGSSIKHNNTIMLRIHEATKERSLNVDWYFAKKLLIEIEMSPTQFAEAITSLNHGTGIPVTIRHYNGKMMDNCPEENKRQLFENEFEKKMVNIAKQIKDISARASEILSNKKAPTKSEKEEILTILNKVRQEISANTPFMYKLFNEQMDKTVLEAKGETEAFFINKINQLGLEELKKNNFKLIE